MSSNDPQKPAHIREFTPRSIAVGLVVALIMGASYPYMVLKFGFGPNVSVVSAFFGFVALGLFSKSYNRWENNVVQTAGTSAGAGGVSLLAAGRLRPAGRRAGQRLQCAPDEVPDVGVVVGLGPARRLSRRAAAQALHRRREPAVPRRHRGRRDAHRARRARTRRRAGRRLP